MCALCNSENLFRELCEKVTTSHLPNSVGVPMCRRALILIVHVDNRDICVINSDCITIDLIDILLFD